MQIKGRLKLRMIVDFAFVCAFGFIAPTALAPIGRSWGIMAVALITFILSIGFLWDGLRITSRLRISDSNNSTIPCDTKR